MANDIDIFHESMMRLAIAQAHIALREREVPIGAVICRNGEIISFGHNRREAGKNALFHAEIEAINNACRFLGGWRLEGCELYVTLEPCPMCAGAIINSRIKTVIFGAKDPKAGACGSVLSLFDYRFNHRPGIVGGILEKDCSRLLTDFFSRLRKN
ncbi:MAG TPA: nucleoside deaminase [Ruminiclostridium sp.]|nr:nucleoside deaminase [Ruminiclostridium sp.]